MSQRELGLWDPVTNTHILFIRYQKAQEHTCPKLLTFFTIFTLHRQTSRSLLHCWSWTQVMECCYHIMMQTRTWSTSVERYSDIDSNLLQRNMCKSIFPSLIMTCFMCVFLCMCVCRGTAASVTLRSQRSRHTSTISTPSALKSPREGWASCLREAWTSPNVRSLGKIRIMQ